MPVTSRVATRGIGGYHRGHQAALATRGDFDGFVVVAVSHQRTDRAEGLDIVGIRLRMRVGGVEDHRRHERTAFGVGVDQFDVGAAVDDGFVAGGQLFDLRKHVGALLEAGERAHAHAFALGVADGGFGESLRQRFGDRVEALGGHDRTPDRGAFLPGLGGDFARDFLDVEIEFDRAGFDVGAEDRTVQRIGFHEEAHRVFDDRGRLFQHQAGRRGTGEADRVLEIELVEQVTGGTADQLHRALRQNSGLDDVAKHQLGQVSGLARGFDDRGYPGEQRRREFFEHAPARES